MGRQSCLFCFRVVQAICFYPKRRLIFSGLHAFMSHKIKLFVVIAMNTSNLTSNFFFFRKNAYDHFYDERKQGSSKDTNSFADSESEKLCTLSQNSTLSCLAQTLKSVYCMSVATTNLNAKYIRWSCWDTCSCSLNETFWAELLNPILLLRSSLVLQSNC
jgi:hypothetical protein